MHDLRLVRGGLPGADRARRQHRRDPPQPGAGGEPLPEGAERGLPQHGDRRQPMGPAEAARASTGRRGWTCPVLGRPIGDAPATAVARHPHPATASCTGSAAPAPSTTATARWCAPWPQLLKQAEVPVRRARPAGDLQRRSGAARRQRVPLPDAGRGERGDPHLGPRRARRPDDRGQLPALLQHHPQRVPAVRPVAASR